MIGRWAQRFAMATKRPVVSFALALAAVAAAAACRGLAGLVMANPPNFMAFFPAILFATLVAGLRGGVRHLNRGQNQDQGRICNK